jgi:DNA polymerase-3 subunit beta
MKFTANSIELQRTLAKLGGVIPTKSPMPILENILCELSGDTLTMSATDTAISLTVTVSVRGEANGAIAIPAKRLMDTMRSLPDTSAKFVIDQDAKKIMITTDTGRYQLTGESAKEFPPTPAFKAGSEIALSGDTLRNIIHRTAFAVSSDELRPAMMGVLFQSKGEELRAVATDGHRLVRLIHHPEQAVSLKRDVVIPAKALQIVGKSIGAGETKISVSDTHVRFTFDGSILYTRLIEEAYPNYESVIPKDNDKLMTVKRDDLVSALRRVSLYASAVSRQVRLEVGSASLVVAAQDADFGGEASEQLACTYSGDSLLIGFNATYLMDILTHLESEQVVFRFSTATRAGIVSPADKADSAGRDNVIMLVMPVRLSN